MPKKKTQRSRNTSPEKAAGAKNVSKVHGMPDDGEVQERVFQQLQEMFSGQIEADVIHMVLSESEWKVDDALDTLFTLTGSEWNRKETTSGIDLLSIASTLSTPSSICPSTPGHGNVLQSGASIEIPEDSNPGSVVEEVSDKQSFGDSLPVFGDFQMKEKGFSQTETDKLSFRDMYNLSKRELECERNSEVSWLQDNESDNTTLYNKGDMSFVEMFNVIKMEEITDDSPAVENWSHLNNESDEPRPPFDKEIPHDFCEGDAKSSSKPLQQTIRYGDSLEESSCAVIHREQLTKSKFKEPYHNFMDAGSSSKKTSKESQMIDGRGRSHVEFIQPVHGQTQCPSDVRFHRPPQVQRIPGVGENPLYLSSKGNSWRTSTLSVDSPVFVPVTPVENSSFLTEKLQGSMQSWHAEHEKEFVVPKMSPSYPTHLANTSWQSVFKSISGTSGQSPLANPYMYAHSRQAGVCENTNVGLEVSDPSVKVWAQKPPAVSQPGKRQEFSSQKRQSHGASWEKGIAALKKTVDHWLQEGTKLLIILRGCPGSGKTTLARMLKRHGVILSTDDFFMTRDAYVFDGSKLGQAHEWNKKRAKKAFERGRTPVIIDNTNTEAWEIKPYIIMGNKYNYKCLMLEPPTPWRYKARELARRNTHGVPIESIKNMLDRFEHNLTVDKVLSTITSDQKLCPKGSVNENVNQNNKILLQTSASDSSISCHVPRSNNNSLEQEKRTEKYKYSGDGKMLHSNLDVVKGTNSAVPHHSLGAISRTECQGLGVSENHKSSSEKDLPVSSETCMNLQAGASVSDNDSHTPEQICSLDEDLDAYCKPHCVAEDNYWKSDHEYSVYDVPTGGATVSRQNPTSDISWEDPKPRRNKKNGNKNTANETLVENSRAVVGDIKACGDTVSSPCGGRIFQVPCLQDIVLSRLSYNDKKVLCVSEQSIYTSLGNTSAVRVCSVDDVSQEQREGIVTTSDVSLARPQALLSFSQDGASRSVVEDLSTNIMPSQSAKVKKSKQNKQSSKRMAAKFTVPKLDPGVKEVLINKDWSLPDFTKSSDSCEPNSTKSSAVILPSTHFRTAFTQTSPDDVILANKIFQGVDISQENVQVLSCWPRDIFARHTLPSSEARLDLSRESSPVLPNKLKLEKGCSTLDLEEQNQRDDIEFLQSCFPEVSRDDLSDILEKCLGDTQLAINNLLDSGIEYNVTSCDAVLLCSDTDVNDGDETVATGNDGADKGVENLVQAKSLSSLCLDSLQKSGIATEDLSDDSLDVNAVLRNRLSPICDSGGNSSLNNSTSEDQLPGGVNKRDLIKPKISRSFSSGNSLELKIDSELASHLQALFGPIGSSADGVTIPLSVSLAYTIHQAWKVALLSIKPPDKDQLAKDEELARILQAEEHKQRIVQRGVHLTSVHSDAPVSNLRQIMAEEKELEMWKQTEFASSPDSLAIRMKRQKLYETFPGIDHAAVEAIFQVNGCDFGRTLAAIRDTCGVNEEAQMVMTPEAAMEYQRQLDLLEQEEQAEQEDYYQSFTEPDYEDYRGEANLHFKQRQECFIKAQEAHRRGMKEVAVFYAQQGRLHTEKIRQANIRAAQKILETKNVALNQANVIDMHGLHVAESIEVLHSVLTVRKEELAIRPDKRRMSIEVITGRGNNSRGGQARIRPAIIDYLKKNNYKFTHPGPGVVKVHF